MLQRLLDERIREKNISIREASRQIGVSHTTLIRIIGGEQCDIPTIAKITNWLGVSMSLVLGQADDNLATTIAAFAASEPRLAMVLDKAMQRVLQRRMKPETLRDLLAYIAYRIGDNDDGGVD